MASFLRRTVLVCAVLITGLLLGTVPSGASGAATCSIRWATPAGGDWQTASNWVPAHVPAATDSVCIGASIPLTVLLSASDAQFQIHSLSVSGVATFELQSTGSSGTVLELSGTATVGSGATIRLADTVPASSGYPGAAIATGSHSALLVVNRGTIITSSVPGGAGATLASGVLNVGTIHAGGPLTVFGLLVNRGTVTVDASQTLVSLYPNATAVDNDTGGTIGGTGTFLVTGNATFRQAGGTVTGSPVVFEGGSALTLAGGGQAEFTLAGTVAVSGKLAHLQTIFINSGNNAGVLSVASGGFTNDGTIFLQGCPSYGGLYPSSGPIVNAGTIEVAGGPCYMFGNYPFTNQGRVTVDSAGSLVATHVTLSNAGGAIANQGSLVLTGSTFQEGAGKVTGVPIDVYYSSTLDFVGTGTSSFALRSGTLQGNVAAGQHVTIEPPLSGDPPSYATSGFTNAGSLALAGGLTLPSSATLTNNGQLSVTAGGSLTGGLTSGGLLRVPAGTSFTVSGPVATTGTLAIGLDAVTGAGALNGTSSVSLGGTLKITTTKVPPSGQTFTIVTGSPVSGSFATTLFGTHPYHLNCTTAACTLSV